MVSRSSCENISITAGGVCTCSSNSAECRFFVESSCSTNCASSEYHCPSDSNSCTKCELYCNGGNHESYSCDEVNIITNAGDGVQQIMEGINLYGICLYISSHNKYQRN